jgi:hypothetical protein
MEDFKDVLPAHTLMLQLDNYWHIGQIWRIPNLVEQNSLIKASDYKKFCRGIVPNLNPKDQNNQVANRGLMIDEKALLPIQKYIEQKFTMIPLCKSFIEAIFYSDLGLNEKINLLWDTLSFFENCNNEYISMALSKGINTETVRYFVNSLAEKCWPSMPESTSENLTDLLFYGRIPTVTKALFLIEEKIIDITDFMVSSLNHVHLGSGKKELDFSKL